jgi:hypothetical protein
MTDTMIFQNIDLSSWDNLYKSFSILKTEVQLNINLRAVCFV